MCKTYLLGLLIYFFSLTLVRGQTSALISPGLGNIYQLSAAQSRSISPENFFGEKGKGGMALTGTNAACARDLGQGWKISPSIRIEKKTVRTIAEVDGPGALQHIWMTPTGNWRYAIIRFYWDGESSPSVEVPVGDFFCQGWGVYAPVQSLAVVVNPGSAFNCYWPMPFHKKCRITMENLDDAEMTLYYQIDYSLMPVPADAAYFHAQFRRVNPQPYKKDYILVDSIRGQGQYVGTYLAYGSSKNGWWGEGEVKFFIDGDTRFPTINGTGTEDYFCGSYDFDTQQENKTGIESVGYTVFSGPYTGLPQVIKGDGHYSVGQRFGLYRWHLTDPVRFEKNLKVTIQDLGWRHDGRYLPLQDDIASTVFWYQTEPHQPFPVMPGRDWLEVN